jgi:hypothetical protein
LANDACSFALAAVSRWTASGFDATANLAAEKMAAPMPMATTANAAAVRSAATCMPPMPAVSFLSFSALSPKPRPSSAFFILSTGAFAFLISLVAAACCPCSVFIESASFFSAAAALVAFTLSSSTACACLVIAAAAASDAALSALVSLPACVAFSTSFAALFAARLELLVTSLGGLQRSGCDLRRGRRFLEARGHGRDRGVELRRDGVRDADPIGEREKFIGGRIDPDPLRRHVDVEPRCVHDRLTSSWSFARATGLRPAHRTKAWRSMGSEGPLRRPPSPRAIRPKLRAPSRRARRRRASP